MFLILISKLVPLTSETVRTLNMLMQLRSSGDLKIISDSRIRSIIAKGSQYRFSAKKDFQKCCENIAASLNEYCSRWCEREHVVYYTLKDWKLNIFKIMDRRIFIYSQTTKVLPRLL